MHTVFFYRQELELKKHKLNELRREAQGKERELSQLKSTSADCKKLMLSNKECLLEYIDHLNGETRGVKEDLVEVEAKNQLYTLLGERTRSCSFLRTMMSRRLVLWI